MNHSGEHTTNAVDAMADAMSAQYAADEDAYRATLDAEQLLSYQRFNREIEDCPACGARDVAVEHDEHPDMIGTSYWTEFSCCGHVRGDGNDALEYNARGDVVDVR